MCEYMGFCHLAHVPHTTQISLRIFKASPEGSCTDTYIHVDKWYTLQVYFGRKTRPDTYICSASAQKAELKVVEVLEVKTWGGAGVSVLVCTAFEMDWWKFGGGGGQ